jgi:hypothetical protein
LYCCEGHSPNTQANANHDAADGGHPWGYLDAAASAPAEPWHSKKCMLILARLLAVTQEQQLQEQQQQESQTYLLKFRILSCFTASASLRNGTSSPSYTVEGSNWPASLGFDVETRTQ